jgi:predicted GTPase
VRLDDPAAVRGRLVLVLEDGPTITHGGMPHGAGLAAALAGGAKEIVDPRASAPASIAALYAQYPHIGPVLPAMGYGPQQLASLLETIVGSSAECVVAGTPIDLAALLPLGRPVVRARYGFSEPDGQPLAGIVDAFVARLRGRGRGPGAVTAA